MNKSIFKITALSLLIFLVLISGCDSENNRKSNLVNTKINIGSMAQKLQGLVLYADLNLSCDGDLIVDQSKKVENGYVSFHISQSLQGLCTFIFTVKHDNENLIIVTIEKTFNDNFSGELSFDENEYKKTPQYPDDNDDGVSNYDELIDKFNNENINKNNDSNSVVENNDNNSNVENIAINIANNQQNSANNSTNQT